MKQLGKKIAGLIIDIVLFGYKMIRQVVLPTKKRKGNILSSLLVFFIGVVERLIHFEHGFFSMATILKRKYVKEGILITGAILFFLASFEWSQERKIEASASSEYAEQFSKITITGTAITKFREIAAYQEIAALNKQYQTLEISSLQFITSSPSVKIYLFTQSFRI